MRAQQRVRVEVERVPRVARRVRLRLVERVEVVPDGLDLAAVVDHVAHAEEHVLDCAPQLRDQVQAAARDGLARAASGRRSDRRRGPRRARPPGRPAPPRPPGGPRSAPSRSRDRAPRAARASARSSGRGSGRAAPRARPCSRRRGSRRPPLPSAPGRPRRRDYLSCRPCPPPGVVGTGTKRPDSKPEVRLHARRPGEPGPRKQLQRVRGHVITIGAT